jgi:hypothetical protein
LLNKRGTPARCTQPEGQIMAVSGDLGKVLEMARKDKNLKEILAAPPSALLNHAGTSGYRQGPIGPLSLTPCAIATNDQSVLHGVLIQAKAQSPIVCPLNRRRMVKRVGASLIEAKHG